MEEKLGYVLELFQIQFTNILQLTNCINLMVQSMANKSSKKFLQFMSPIVIVFQFFGIAPRITPSNYKDIMHLMFQYFRIALVSLILFYNPEIIGQAYEITSQVTLKILLLSYAVSVFEAIVTRERQLKIIKQLCRIDELISTKLCADFDSYSDMKKQYTRLIWCVCLGVVILKILHCILFNRAPLVLTFTWAYAHFGISMRLLQNAFYVDMVFERLCILHKELSKLKYNCRNVQQQLNLTSDIYGKLWMMTNDINFSFGLSLLAIILECVVDLIDLVNVMYSNCDTSKYFITSISKLFYSHQFNNNICDDYLMKIKRSASIYPAHSQISQ